MGSAVRQASVIFLTLIPLGIGTPAHAALMSLQLSGKTGELSCDRRTTAGPTGSMKSLAYCGPPENPTLIVQTDLGWTAIQRDNEGEPAILKVLQAKAGSKVLYKNPFSIQEETAPPRTDPAVRSTAELSAQARAISNHLSFFDSASGSMAPISGLGEPIQPLIDEFHRKASARFIQLDSLLARAESIEVTTPAGTSVECRRSRRKPDSPEPPGCEFYLCPKMQVNGREYEALLYHPGILAVWRSNPRLMLSSPESLGPVYLSVETRIPGHERPLYATGISNTEASEASWQDSPIPSVGISMNAYQDWATAQMLSKFIEPSESCAAPEVATLLQRHKDAFAAAKEKVLGLEIVQVLESAQDGFRSNLLPSELIDDSTCKDEAGRVWGKENYSESALRRYERRMAPHSGRAVPLSRAQKLFDQLKAREDIPWGYTPDGCYARAEIAENFLEWRGIEVSKTWIHGVLTPKADPDVHWGYHVAASIPVQRQDGSVVQMVMDPALASTPVTEEEWTELMLQAGPLLRTDFPPPDNAQLYGRTLLSRSSDYPYIPSGDVTESEGAFRRDAKKENRAYREEWERSSTTPPSP